MNITVNQNGKGDFRTVQEAIDSVPEVRGVSVTIEIRRFRSYRPL